MKTHARSLIRLIKEHCPSQQVVRGAEVGVWRGGLSATLLHHIPGLFLHLVDPWDLAEDYHKAPRELRAAKAECEAAVRFSSGNFKIVQQNSVPASDTIVDGSLDFVFIDANHHYEHVAEDVAAWTPKVRVGGLMSGHDYNGTNDRRGRWGVKRAVDEYAQEHGYEVTKMPGLVWAFTVTHR